MDAQQSSATQRRSRGGRRIVTVRRLGLVVSLLVVFLLGATSVASASSFYWYGESPDCWQTGQPGSSGKACDYPGGSEIYDAVTGDLNATASGDYCNPYDGTIGQELSGATCANEDASWPLSFSDSTTNCTSSTAACGIQHYVSLINQDDLPWSSNWFGKPALVISADLNVTSVSNPTNAWEYICPLLKAPEQPYYLELCFDEWQGAAPQGNLPKPPFSEDGYGLDVSCAGVTVKGVGSSVDTFVSPFALGEPTPYATTLSGSTNTISGGTTGGAKVFTAEITLANLENVINRDNAAPGTGCGRGLSSNLAGYQLVGVEDGNEGRPTMKLAATVSNLQLHTEYTPLPPEASTSEATEKQLTQAKLNGTVNPRGTATEYYFQYGKTGYEKTTAVNGAGSGQGPVGESATVTGLEPVTTYHFRIVAKNSAGQEVTGNEQTFTTSSVNSSADVVREGTKYEAVFYRNTAGGLSYWSYSPSGGWENKTLGGEVAAGTSPSVVHESNGYTAAYYVSKTGGIDYWAYASGSWVDIGLGGEVAAGTSPYGLREGSYNGVFYVNKKGELAYWTYGSGWEDKTLGGEVAAGTSPSVVHESNGYTAAYYVSKTGGIDYWAYASGSWVDIGL
jgi:hypothetical protein